MENGPVMALRISAERSNNRCLNCFGDSAMIKRNANSPMCQWAPVMFAWISELLGSAKQRKLRYALVRNLARYENREERKKKIGGNSSSRIAITLKTVGAAARGKFIAIAAVSLCSSCKYPPQGVKRT